ncbi:stage II sporulation protein AA (anti-sigma F factor antagonist) [Anaerosolibacter carboniphilus]|uniref:Anti-sigma F factor antagonist n=1 Tax=Anaerosolibacter carboniphilus TaxID=1417629 RepID=A0A841KRP5_9FIRM|nr:anti-sigma F factor antagonist [Anaerosolibacter carboniphilus]MBB6216031.1 stage II sporulation protein AA (anti-sigma F factor antagonist) [Anaerosolibacter carboniphilus]
MRLSFENINKNLVIKLDGELDHHTAEEIRDEIDREIDHYSVKNIIFDLSGMNFMDSSGIGVVIGRYKKVSKMGGEVAVININSRVERIFKMSGLFNIVKRFENKNQAVDSL